MFSFIKFLLPVYLPVYTINPFSTNSFTGRLLEPHHWWGLLYIVVGLNGENCQDLDIKDEMFCGVHDLSYLHVLFLTQNDLFLQLEFLQVNNILYNVKVQSSQCILFYIWPLCWLGKLWISLKWEKTKIVLEIFLLNYTLWYDISVRIAIKQRF